MIEQNEQQDLFIQHAERYEQAYRAHVKKHVLLNPRPQEPVMSELITWHHYIIAVILIASAIISASHTLPVVLIILDNEETHFLVAMGLSVATFIMIELTAIYFSYAHIVSSSRQYEIPDISTPLHYGVISTVGAMFAINIYGVLDASGKLPIDESFKLVWGIIAVVIYLWVACIPPINAYLCGDILAINVLGLKHENSVALDDYEDALSRWRDGVERSWNAKKKEYGDSIKVSKPVPQIQEVVENTNNSKNSIPIGNGKMESNYGFQRNSTALDKAIAHYTENPEALDIDPVQLAPQIGIGKSTLYKARRIVKEG